MPLYEISLVATAVAGFSVALYIFNRKRKQKKMICFLHANCESVVYSKYSVFLGIPVEILGLIYYGIVALNYTIIAIFPQLSSSVLITIIYFLTGVAFLFSVYLLSIQALSLKQWCSWCLISALLCTTIFFISMMTNKLIIATEVLEKYDNLIYPAYLISISFGVLMATIYGILIFKFLKDKLLSTIEARVLDIVSQLIWTSLLILIPLIISFYSFYPEKADQLMWFWKKAITAILALITAILLNILIIPSLLESFFENKKIKANKKFYLFVITLNALSIILWHYLFLAVLTEKLLLKEVIIIYIFTITLVLSGIGILESYVKNKIVQSRYD